MAFATKMSITAGLLMLGYLAIISAGADIVPQCPPKWTGRIAYPHNCRLFVQCYGGRGRVVSCGPWESFNVAISDCDAEAAVPECEDGGFIDMSLGQKSPNPKET